jgi:hypothetical protein
MGVVTMQRSVKKLLGQSVVRLVAYMQSGLDMDYTEYERMANMASEINAGYKCTFNRGPMKVPVKEILHAKEMAKC